jgi:hypothetical protein
MDILLIFNGHFVKFQRTFCEQMATIHISKTAVFFLTVSLNVGHLSLTIKVIKKLQISANRGFP